MTFVKIPASETDFNSPGNETLLDKMRENFDEIMRSKPMLERFSGYRPDGGGWTYEMNAITTTGIGAVNLAIYRIYIPTGIISLMVNIYAYDNFNDANHGIRIIINGVNLDFKTLPAAIAWRTEAEIVPGAVGWQDVTVQVISPAANWIGGVRGITIRPNV